MSAKELFEEQGYTRQENDYCIEYSLDKRERIYFWKEVKRISTEHFRERNGWIECYYREPNENELQLIYKQVEELGWLDE